MSRAFQQLNQQITNSSDFTKAKRDAVTYIAVSKNKNSNDYKSYDNNFIVSSDASACLVSSRSYADYLSISKGKRHVNPVLSGASAGKYQSWLGNFLTLNTIDVSNSAPAVQDLSFNGNIISGGVNTISFPKPIHPEQIRNNYPGYIEDPNNKFNFNTCRSADNDLPRYITEYSILDPDRRSSKAYWRAVAGQNMGGFDFPSKPTLNSKQYTDLQNAPYAPISSVDTSLNEQKQWERWCSLNGNTTN